MTIRERPAWVNCEGRLGVTMMLEGAWQEIAEMRQAMADSRVFDDPDNPYADDDVWLCCGRPTDEDHAPDCGGSDPHEPAWPFDAETRRDDG